MSRFALIAILFTGLLLSVGCASGVPEIPKPTWGGRGDWKDWHPTYSSNNARGEDVDVEEATGRGMHPAFPDDP